MWEIPVFVLYTIFAISLFFAFFYLGIFLKTQFKGRKKGKKRIFDITFIIPAYNAAKLLDKTVDSIMNSNYPKNKIKIIIVNDGSKDNTLEVARGLAKKYRNIEVLTKENSGKANSLNYGLKRAKTELVAVLDADTLLKEDLLEKSVALFDDDIAAVTCRFKPLIREKLIEKIQYVEYSLTAFYRFLMGQIKSLPAAPAFTIFRREFFEKYGYFDPGNLTEDFEMGLRIQKHNYGIGYVADSYAITDVPDSIKKLFRQRLRWNYGALYNYAKYKELIFSKLHGDLGMFVIPSGYISALMICVSIIISIYLIFSNVWHYANLLMLGWVPSFSFDIISTNMEMALTNLRFLMIAFIFLLGLILYFLARVYIDEDIPLTHYILMISIYLFMLGFIYLVAFAYFIIGKKPNW
ncbi:MAG: glycosyltransferase family 2 protein [Candidatus Pacearchaeota archaeon]|nr:glycosyltransferase family 2 protein [Candidatus Pacearchaeota archaeon]